MFAADARGVPVSGKRQRLARRIHQGPALIAADPCVVTAVGRVRRREVPRQYRERDVVGADRIRHPVDSIRRQRRGYQVPPLRDVEVDECALMLLSRLLVERGELTAPPVHGRLARLPQLGAAVGMHDFRAGAIPADPPTEFATNTGESSLTQLGRKDCRRQARDNCGVE